MLRNFKSAIPKIVISAKSLRLLLGLFFILGVHLPATIFSDSLNTATESAIENVAKNVQSQQQIDQLDDETRQLFSEYRTLLQTNQQLEEYLAQLKVLLEDQNQEIARKEKEITSVKGFEREVLPLLNRMIRALAKMIENDMPFLPEERNKRVEKLNHMMTASNINVAEKFRRVFEAYQVEGDYGNNMETYRGSVVESSGNDKVVDFLRVGRNVLLYQTLDGNERAVWDMQEQQWQALSERYRPMVREAILIARKQVAPNLLILPVQAASPLENRR